MKYDLKKDRKDLYHASTKEFGLVDVDARTYLAIDGSGDPNTSPEYSLALQALYGVAYAVKFAAKERDADFVVGPLEGLWTSDDPSAFLEGRKDEWSWTMLIPLPEQVTDEDIEHGLSEASRKKPELAIEDVRALRLHEGLSLQIMHVGGYDAEGPTLARLHNEVMPEGGWTFNGPHHEIYLSDPRTVSADKLRTILRQPVAKINGQVQ